MSTEPEPTYVVVATDACGSHDNGLHDGRAPCQEPNPIIGMLERGRCNGCMKDGRRALLDTAQPVERQPIIGAFRHFWAYVAISDRNASVRVPIETWPPVDPEEDR